MHWMEKLERKFGKYAIPNLIIYILVAYGIGYVLILFSPDFYEMLQMNPAAIFHGQVWRLVTWITCIPESLDIFTVLMFMFYYWIGKTLEGIWGSFRYNVYMFLGIILTGLGPILMYLVIGVMYGFSTANLYGASLTSSTYYINLTSFLAFALIFPNQEVYFMFIFRVKMKWLAIADGVLLAYSFLSNIGYAVRASSGEVRLYAISRAVCLLCSVASFLIYYFSTRNYKRFSPKEVKRRHKYHKQVREAKDRGTKHYCAICGRTEVSNPELQFRYCSKCKGNLEYCNDHLFTHQHKM